MKRARAVTTFAAALCVAVACSTYSGEDGPSEPQADSGSGTDAANDTRADVVDAADAAACNHGAQWGDLQVLAELGSGNDEWAPRLTADELTITFASSRTAGGVDVWVATRQNRNLPFDPPTLLGGGINTDSGIEVHPTITGDGRTIYYQSKRPGGSEDRIYRSTRASTLQPFGPGALVPELVPANQADFDITPFISVDGTYLLFASTRGKAVPDFDIWESRKQVDAAFAPPSLVSEVSVTPYRDETPVISADGLTLYFASWRDNPTSGDIDIYRATRFSIADGFGPPVRVTELSTVNYEAPGWLSPDGCRLYFLSNRPFDGGLGALELFLARKP